MEGLRFVFFLVLTIGLFIGFGYVLSWLNKGQFPAKSFGDYLVFIVGFSLMFLGAWLQQR